ncbi:MAG: tRNA (adenosine(37)-N6)-threonylcarbamoyltransferase complex dimerization subunit type 1 TsaB [Bacillota bacterium]|nr:tRNA (adenosine(37)-N6)-threonylcarbamoyltransferase complex dimerization subunit type 1 TsaB [Bacillota bacterium]
MILSLDSSAGAASVCLYNGEKVIGQFFINAKLTHSETLMPMIAELLDNTRINIHDVDCFAVSSGPGSFTGLRIGISAIKGMAFAENKPCVSVSTLLAMDAQIEYENYIICAVMDARCNQVYNALFKNHQRLTDDRAITIDELKIELKGYNERILFVGDGAELCYNAIKEENENVFIAPLHLRYQSAYGVAFAATQKYKNKEFLSAVELSPVYLRLPQAERELRKRNNL